MAKLNMDRVEMLKKLLRSLVPERYRPIGYLTHLAKTRTRMYVAGGPFKGTRYGERSFFSAYIPKLLGIYERELWGVIEAICESGPTLVVDIGAAEGYYAIGLANLLPKVKIIAYEASVEGRDELSKMIRLNNCEKNVEVREFCDTTELNAILSEDENSKNTVIICDVEGYEETLIDNNLVPGLGTASILIEIHEFICAGILEQMISRFDNSHVVHTIWQTDRTINDFPWRTFYTSILPQSYLEWAVSEWRPIKMCWLWMVPKKLNSNLHLTRANMI